VFWQTRWRARNSFDARPINRLTTKPITKPTIEPITKPLTRLVTNPIIAIFKVRKPLLIFPFNGNGLEALDCLGDEFELIGFVDDTPEKQGLQPSGVQVFSRVAFAQWPLAQVLAVPGSALSYLNRQALIDGLALPETRFARVVHASARISPLASLGHNLLVMAGVVVTSNATLGDHVCVLPNTVIHHDVQIGAHSLLGSNVTVAGHTQVGRNCYVGSGSHLMNGLQIGDGALVGLGSTVIRNVEAGTRVAGNPARPV
jgi:sugar O-acyltransferase (sialic acid O-acetyltransferase NeuD family)